MIDCILLFLTEVEIEALSRCSGPPDTPIPYELNTAWNVDDLDVSLNFPQHAEEVVTSEDNYLVKLDEKNPGLESDVFLGL